MPNYHLSFTRTPVLHINPLAVIITMRPTTLVLALASSVTTVMADCNRADARPDTGDIALYSRNNCSGAYLNVGGAIGRCESQFRFDACSAITRLGVVCQIFSADGCTGSSVLIDSTGYRNFCGSFGTVESVYCAA
jgi:hypothetical protein